MGRRDTFSKIAERATVREEIRKNPGVTLSNRSLSFRKEDTWNVKIKNGILKMIPVHFAWSS